MTKRRSAAILLAFLLVLTSGSIVQARGNDSTRATSIVVTPFYDYITALGANLSIGSLGKAVSTGFVYYPGDYDSTLTIELQRSNGTGWTTVKSWSESFSGWGHHSLEEEYYVTSGYTYKVVTTATVKEGSIVLETASSTSSEVTY